MRASQNWLLTSLIACWQPGRPNRLQVTLVVIGVFVRRCATKLSTNMSMDLMDGTKNCGAICQLSAVADTLDLSRPYMSEMRHRPEPRRRGRPPLPDAGLVADIRLAIADLPTYGYRRVHALLRRQAEQTGRAAPNPKRVYRVMKLQGLILQRHRGRSEERRHDGRIAVTTRNKCWCSDGLGIGCENGEKVRVAFALDCCGREAMGYVATTGITAQDVRDLMVATVEHRFGQVNKLPHAIEWLTDKGSCYTARDTRRFARDIGLIPRTTPGESPKQRYGRGVRPHA